MDKNNFVTKRYSEGFMLKILSELRSGKYSKYLAMHAIAFHRAIPKSCIAKKSLQRAITGKPIGIKGLKVKRYFGELSMTKGVRL